MEARDVVVFLGPSLAADAARRVLPARYLGPARCGDVLRARRLSPRVIAIVDGVFARTAAVWHKEILLAMDDGIAVYGASSMGALRAAELEPFGMVGVGKIFEAYRDGIYEDDDEVALLHGAADSNYREMSEAMVNIRATVAHAVESGIIRAESAERVIRCAKDTFYQERSLSVAIDRVWGRDAHGEAARFRRFVGNGGYVNQKHADALALLSRLAAVPAVSPCDGPPVHRTSFIRRLSHDTACAPFDAPDPDLPQQELVALEAASSGPLYPLVRRLAQLLSMAYALARRRAVSVEPGLLERVHDSSDMSLGPAARSERWARALDLDDSARAAFIERLAAIRGLVDDDARRRGRREAGRRRRQHLLDAMRINGVYAQCRPAGKTATGTASRSVLRKARRKNPGAFALYSRIATVWSVVDGLAEEERIGHTGTPQGLSNEFRRARGLEHRTATLAWRRANDLDARSYDTLVVRHARLSAMCAGTQQYLLGWQLVTDPVCWLLDAIRLSGMYPELKRRVAHGSAPRAIARVSIVRVCNNGAPIEKAG